MELCSTLCQSLLMILTISVLRMWRPAVMMEYGSTPGGTPARFLAEEGFKLKREAVVMVVVIREYLSQLNPAILNLAAETASAITVRRVPLVPAIAGVELYP